MGKWYLPCIDFNLIQKCFIKAETLSSANVPAENVTILPVRACMLELTDRSYFT